MLKNLICNGDTMEDAINNGLKKMNLSIDQVDTEIIEEGKSILNVVLKPYRVRLVRKDSNEFVDSEDGNINEVSNFFEIVEVSNEWYLSITPKQDTEMKKDSEKIILLLKDKGFDNIDEIKLKSLLEEKKQCVIKIEELKYEPKDAQVELEITRDQMNAYVTIIPPKGGKMVTSEELYNILKEKKIVYGILTESIDDIVINPIFNTRKPIAEGSIPINGTDGKINYLFDKSIIMKPKVLENGNVDFKELNIIKNICKGDVLAERILPTEGFDGKTITGNILKAKPGKPIFFKKGKNVIENEDATLLIATEDGCPKLLDEKVTVLQIYEINGNVDNSTGNIYFNGKIIVRGNVCTGFKVQCDGDVEVYGVVEGAEIHAEGDIILHKGIQGHNMGKIYSKKNITAGYMESCYASAHGSIYADVVLHCVLESKDSIVVMGKKGMLVGGEARSNVEISAISIGSPMTTTTKLEVGIDPEMKQRFDSLKQEQEVLYKNRESVVKAIELLTKLAKTTNLPEDKQAILQKSIKTKVYLEEKIKNVNTLILEIQDTLQDLSSGKIHVKNIIYPGVKISIGNSALYVRDSIKNATVIKEDGEIKTTVYMGK